MKNAQHGFGILEFMIALSLSAIILVTLFHLFISMKNVYQRQMVLSDRQDNMRFISLFLSNKIRMTGNYSCQTTKLNHQSIMIRAYTSDDAKDKLDLTIKSGTALLQLRECIRFHDRKQFLPIDFFVADTHRVNNDKKIIDGLFMKINHHPREELLSEMTDFQVHFITEKKRIALVTIDYTLSSSQLGVLTTALRMQYA